MKHRVYTRCKYDTDQEVADRLKLTRRFTLPALLAQERHTPFGWVWLCQPRHSEMITASLREGGWKGEIAFNEMKMTRHYENNIVTRLGFQVKTGDEDIQTALDSDDWVHPRWINQVQDYWSVVPGGRS